MRGHGALIVAVVVALTAGGCRTCADWGVSPGTKSLDAEGAAALERMPDGSCDTTILPILPVLISNRMQLESTGEGEFARRTLREESGGLFDLLMFRRNESVYGAGGHLIEWRSQRSFLLGITQSSASGAPSAEGSSTWRLLGGLLGSETHGERTRWTVLWISFGG